MRTRLYKYGIALSVAIAGAIVGVGAFTFRFADGLSYFSTDPEACANCHIMNDQFASWTQGPHHLRGIGCVDCHLPHALVPKLIAKASNGYHHSKAFTLQDFHEPILIKPHNTEILLERAASAATDTLDAIGAAKRDGAKPQTLAPALELQRKARWRLDFAAAENSMGFHAPAEAARILGESIDYSRQAQLAARAQAR